MPDPVKPCLDKAGAIGFITGVYTCLIVNISVRGNAQDGQQDQDEWLL